MRSLSRVPARSLVEDVEGLLERAEPVSSDGFGDRLVAFERDGTPTWEWLRLRQDFSRVAGIDVALLRRTELLASLAHPALPPVRLFRDAARRDQLVLRTPYVPGRRLSELARPRGAVFALNVACDLTHALATMQRQGDAVAHGALNADRILVNPLGELIVQDHALGAVLDALNLPSTRLWSELGVICPWFRRVPARQLDVMHIAVVALSVVLGRALAPHEVPGQVRGLIDRAVVYRPLRDWLMAAFGLDGTGLASAGEAHEAAMRASPATAAAGIRASLAEFAAHRVESPAGVPVSRGFADLIGGQDGTVLVLDPGAAPLPSADPAPEPVAPVRHRIIQ